MSKLIAGVDEAGRGPLAGPVVAAAVILPQDYVLLGLTDSKKLSATKRQLLEEQIKDQALAWAIGMASAYEIDQINILQASLLAMQRAVYSLNPAPTHAIVDGNQAPQLHCPVQCLIRGDLLEPCISAASILAKQARDLLLVQMDEQYPVYGFAQHKAYPTPQHIKALHDHGICSQHRKTFAPVRRILKAS